VFVDVQGSVVSLPWEQDERWGRRCWRKGFGEQLRVSLRIEFTSGLAFVGTFAVHGYVNDVEVRHWVRRQYEACQLAKDDLDTLVSEFLCSDYFEALANPMDSAEVASWCGLEAKNDE